MKRILFFAVALLTAGLLFAEGATETSADGPILIGVAGAHSGDLASYGLPTVNAAELVVEQVNANGGLLGRTVELVVEDEQCKPEIATNVATKLVGEGVPVVIGHICSGATEAALSIYLAEQIVTISPSATNPTFTQSGDYPNFFRTIAPDDAQARLQVDFALDVLGVTQIAILHDKQTYGKGLAEFAQGFLQEAGIEPLLFEGVTPGAVDYSAIINRVADSGAEAVIYGGYHPEASRLVGQMRDRNMDTLFISGDGVKDDTFIDVAGEDSEGVYASGPVDTTQSAAAIAAADAHRAKYGTDPGPFFYNAYAAAQAVVNAIEVAGSTDYDDIVAALKSEYVDTPLGSISFDEAGDAIGVGFSMYQVQNGVYVEL